VPSSLTLAPLEVQLIGAVTAPACCSVKPAVLTEGQETTALAPERRTESVGKGSRYARAMCAASTPPAVPKRPPAYRSPPEVVSARRTLSSPEPSADQLLPSHLAMCSPTLPSSAVEKKPPAYRSLPDTASARTWSLIPGPNADQLLPPHLAT